MSSTSTKRRKTTHNTLTKFLIATTPTTTPKATITTAQRATSTSTKKPFLQSSTETPIVNPPTTTTTYTKTSIATTQKATSTFTKTFIDTCTTPTTTKKAASVPLFKLMISTVGIHATTIASNADEEFGIMTDSTISLAQKPSNHFPENQTTTFTSLPKGNMFYCEYKILLYAIIHSCKKVYRVPSKTYSEAIPAERRAIQIIFNQHVEHICIISRQLCISNVSSFQVDDGRRCV